MHDWCAWLMIFGNSNSDFSKEMKTFPANVLVGQGNFRDYTLWYHPPP